MDLVEMKERDAAVTRSAAIEEWRSREMGLRPDRYSLPNQLMLPAFKKLRQTNLKQRSLMDAWKASFIRSK